MKGKRKLLIFSSPHVRECGFWNQGKFWLWNPESWDLESGIQLKDSESHVIQNPSSTPKFLYMGRFLRQLEREQFHAGRLVLKREIPAEFLAYEATLLWS